MHRNRELFEQGHLAIRLIQIDQLAWLIQDLDPEE
jgi:hypothetical protein